MFMSCHVRLNMTCPRARGMVRKGVRQRLSPGYGAIVLAPLFASCLTAN